MTAELNFPDLSARQQKILAQARAEGKVLVDQLANVFDKTPQSIRRDLSELCQLRLLQRIHGGAIAMDTSGALGYEARKLLETENKKAIGQCAAKLIPNGASLFINIGTTTEQVTEHLLGHKGLLAITNNLNVVNILRKSEQIKIITAGGTVRREDGGIVGNSTSDFINQYKVDFAVIGASALEEDGTILDYDTREVKVAQAIIRNARTVMLVADKMKFKKSAPVRIANIAQVDYFITDTMPSEPFLNVCQANSVIVKTGSDMGEPNTMKDQNEH